MATYTITINERTATGKNLVAFLRSLKNVVSISKIAAIDESLADVRNGKTYKAKNAKDLIEKCLK
ncbi:MAG: hypothetical protein ABFS35_13545 [Bacteroidota bacterium]